VKCVNFFCEVLFVMLFVIVVLSLDMFGCG